VRSDPPIYLVDFNISILVVLVDDCWKWVDLYIRVIWSLTGKPVVPLSAVAWGDIAP